MVGLVEIAPGESEVLQHVYAVDAMKAWQSAISYTFEHKADAKAIMPGFVSKRQAKRDAAARTNRLAAVFSTVNVNDEDDGTEKLTGGTSFCVRKGPAPGRPKKPLAKRPSRPPADAALLNGMSAEERALNGLPPAHIPPRGAHPPTPGKKVVKRPSAAPPAHATASISSDAVPVATAVVAGEAAARPRKVVRRSVATTEGGELPTAEPVHAPVTPGRRVAKRVSQTT
jgi:hypothetical protein